MKRFSYRLLPLLAVVLLLSGCERYPTATTDGSAWDESWTILGDVMGIEDPGNGFTLLDNNTALSFKDIYYATFTSGTPSTYTNEDGDEVDLCEAQIYILVNGCKDEENARLAIREWQDRESETYRITETAEENHGDLSYTVCTYETDSDSNPYSRGASAFGVFGSYAINVEVTCQESWTGDPAAVLAGVLDGAHFSADLT